MHIWLTLITLAPLWTLASLEMLHLIIRTPKLSRWRFTCRSPHSPTLRVSRTFPSFPHTPPLCSVSQSPRVGRAEPWEEFPPHFSLRPTLKVRLGGAFSRPAELLRPPTCTKFLSLGSFHCSYPGCRRQLRGQRPPIRRGQRYAAAPAGDFLLPDIPQTMTLTRQTALRAAWIGGNCRTIRSIFILIKLNNILFQCFSEERAWACSKSCLQYLIISPTRLKHR